MTTAPIYLDRPPSGLLARLCYCFKLAEGRWVCYPRQEDHRMLETTQGDTDLGQLHDARTWLRICESLLGAVATLESRVRTLEAQLKAATCPICIRGDYSDCSEHEEQQP